MKIKIIQADITTLSVDAVVNAANNHLLGGGGIDGAIHRAAGLELRAECATLGGCRTGEAKITSAYQLPARYVIHTVGPRYGQENGQEAELLSTCYLSALQLAADRSLTSIAFPAISTGVFKYPKREAAAIAVRTIRSFLNNNEHALEEVLFVVADQENHDAYTEAMVESEL